MAKLTPAPTPADGDQTAAKSQSQRFYAISADVTNPEENDRVLAVVTEWNNGQPPDIVWANAGSAHPTLFVDTSLETMKSQMDINYWAASYLAHATLKIWLKSATKTASAYDKSAKPRHFIMTSSVAAFAGLAGYAPYSPAKAALRSLADTLRSELNLYNGYRRANPSQGPAADVRVHCVFPAGIISPGLENENTLKHPVTKILEEDDKPQTEDEVAAAAVKGLERGGTLITTNLMGGAMRASMLGGSARTNWLVDTLFAWLANVIWLFVGPDLVSLDPRNLEGLRTHALIPWNRKGRCSDTARRMKCDSHPDSRQRASTAGSIFSATTSPLALSRVALQESYARDNTL